MQDFDYLKPDDVYLDAACQSLRPRPVIDALNRYYTEHNSCGERVKYAWGQTTDSLVEETRTKLLKYLKLKSRDYFVSFTLNTTYGINLILAQLPPNRFQKVITSDIEHNSPFLATIAYARQHDLPREVLSRNEDGSLPLDADYTNALVVVNVVSNIDGRTLTNLKDLVKTVHKQHGIIILDAAQALAHNSDLLHKTDADALCSSAHKAYGASLGVIVARRELIKILEPNIIGGGMVDDVDRDRFQLSAQSADHIYTRFEPGLQAWGEIIAFGAALDWLTRLPRAAHESLAHHSETLYDFLSNHPKVSLLNHAPTPTQSFYIDGLDSHLVGDSLSDQGVMARTGYFCVHYYLDHVMHYPPLIRFSLGYHTRASDIEKTIALLERMLG
ncbi:aminotransferase class V-fold PLP-dependent enzyme [Candidatus Saccharibacteria bacterium]|nr:aminotransferase class V-fold PLP-dependent enzyme [Candidatus Saccharibacteria bacterium]